MIQEKNLSIVEAWNELNKVNNKIELLETLLKSKLNITSSKLKEILVKCSITNNDKFINTIISKDDDIIQLGELYDTKNGWEKYIRNEIKISKISNPAICVAFLKEYYIGDDNKRMTFEDIAKELGYSLAQTKRYYYEDYKGATPKDNSWQNEAVKLK